MALLIFYVTLALAVSFLCSVMEAVLLSVTPSWVAESLRKPGLTGRRFKAFKDDIDRPLAAILTLNTIAHTVGATGAGAQAIKVFGEAWVGVISAVLTLLILFVSEIIPKTLGAVYWRQLAPPIGVVLKFTMAALYPLVWISQGLTRLLTPKDRELGVSRRELEALAELGAAEGVIDEHESKVVRNLLRFGMVRVSDIMTPRVVMVSLPEDQSIDATFDHNAQRFSRIPIHGTDRRDDITGFVLKDDLLLHSARGEGDRKLREFRRDFLVVPPSTSLPVLFERLLEQSEHIALVADEYGDVHGLVTMEDLIETLLGREIVDEADSVEDMRELAHRHWQRRARRLGLLKEDDAG